MDSKLESEGHMTIEHPAQYWMELADRSTQELFRTIGLGLHLDEPEFRPEDFDGGFSVRVRSERIGNAPLDFGIRGIVGGQEIDGVVSIGAWLFVYCGGRRVSISSDRPLLFLTFRAHDPGEGAWTVNGWVHEEHGEFDAFLNFDQDQD